MEKSGHGNDGVMVLVPIAVTIVLGVAALGGPSAALDALNRLIGSVAHVVISTVNGLL